MSLQKVEDKLSLALSHAIGENNIESVFDLVSKHPGLANRSLSSKHPTFLHYAIWLDSSKTGSAVCYEIYKCLADFGADANLVDRNGLNCLLYALQYPIIRTDPQSFSKLTLLSHQTVDLNYKPPGVGGFPAFIAAIRVPSTVDLGMTLLFDYSHESKVNLNNPVLLAGNRKQYPISCALLNNIKIQYVKYLLVHGADPNLPGPNEWLPLFLCMEHTNKLDYLALLCNEEITSIDIRARNGNNLNALQALLRSHVEPSTVRAKLRILFKKYIDVRELCSVGSVSSEKISVLHFIIHDGITVQHKSPQTRDIGAQLSHEFTLSSYEHAKLTFHRGKSLRERESFHGGLPGLSSTGSTTSSPTGSNQSNLRRLVQQQQEELQQQHLLFSNPIGQRNSAPRPTALQRLTSPRASEHSLRLPLLVPQLDLPHEEDMIATDIIASQSLMQDVDDGGSGGVVGNTMDDLLEAANAVTIPTQFSQVPSAISNSMPQSPLQALGSHPIFQTTPQQHNSLRSNHGSVNNFTHLTRQGSHQSNASNNSYRSTRSYATMPSYWSLPPETIRLLTEEREAQDIIDAKDLDSAIQVAIALIYDDIPVSGEAHNDGTKYRPFFPACLDDPMLRTSHHEFDFDDLDQGRISTMSDIIPHVLLQSPSSPQPQPILRLNQHQPEQKQLRERPLFTLVHPTRPTRSLEAPDSPLFETSSRTSSNSGHFPAFQKL